MSKIWKKVALLGVIAVMCLSTTGCDKTIAEQKDKIEQLEATIVEKNAEISELQIAVNDTTVKEEKITTSLQKVEGKLVPEFKYVDEAIVFPNKFELPSATKDITVSKIKIGSRFTISPSSNWQVKIDGNTLSFAHPAKAWGEVKSLIVTDRWKDTEAMKAMLQPFYTGFPATTIRYRQISHDSMLSGMVSDAEIVVEEIPYHVVVGFTTKGDNALEFLFVYQEDGTGVQGELVDTLIKSVESQDTRIAIE